ncbi:preprotein translocase subunit SecG [Acetobacterium wieringae]|jgi:preprotein translocase subunit SecG|uniref:Protein-export membrane protein SecG n=2 Tax=Acetobacterium TaxID=33951 RepID=A0A1F2PK45_9FIRM|nr:MULTISPECIES: preprotein translocase subunit SecG [Acetobacterium]HAZ05970.1 preprotein translocase subunit SecG [Acetobacterium sp.]MEA4805909.1 preprotein translocase subunit SecG [Acetobacterium wieringae]OFV71687.1 preprotein translocase subunit SecG [Acetobacterium wieringae]OXS27401.1 MAG: preprotein translocase subunit SecG [Acetobacterium sp. MES1]TYC85994.1 preprotein translocase subunit SecG [Acetobacterium wieringae]
MKEALLVVLLISSLVLIAAILLSPGKTAGMSGAIAGGAETLFGKKKAKGFEGVLEKATKISGVLFMLSAFVYSIVS